MNTRKMRNTKGITLVALIVTIIVLLILAGISLNLIMGEKGITQRAVNAGKVHNISGAKEKLELKIADYAGEYYQAKYVNRSVDANDVGTYVLGKFSPEETTFEENYYLKKENSKLILTSSDRTTTATCTVDSNGKVEWEGTEIDENSEPNPYAKFGEANTDYAPYFGMLIDGYNPPKGSEWRLFYVDENFAYLISKSIGKETLDSLSGFGGDLTLDAFALGRNLNSKYTNWGMKSDGININNNIKAVAGLLDTTKWNEYKVSPAEWAIGAPTLEMFIASYNATHTDVMHEADSQIISQQLYCNYDNTLNWTGYKVKIADDSDYSDYIVGLGLESTLDKVIYSSSDYWWLASPSSGICDGSSDRNMVVFAGNIYNAALAYTDYDEACGIRPLVCIPISNIGIAGEGEGKTITVEDYY